MRRYDVALGQCRSCRVRVRRRHPEQTSDALGAAGVMLGPRAHALAAWLHVGLGVPMAKVAKILAALDRCSELIGDAVAGQAKVPHALRRILLDALAVRDEGLSSEALGRPHRRGAGADRSVLRTHAEA